MEREKCRNLRILLGESLVELFDFIEEDLQLVGRWQDGHSEMVGPIFLAKATARYEADSRFLQHLHAIKHVWLLSLFLRERKGNIICTNLDILVAWGSLTKSYTYNRKL